ncbi:MAG TPA: class IV adenylate cyclase [Bryobacteraceae bacterium]|jgi:adenylate cyclase class 2|nr:class IV adenylate cyclase [Bryobacteraceae bacterium]
MAAPVEIEVKIAVAGVAKARKILREGRFHAEGSRVFERNLVLDNAQGNLKRKGLLLRLRTTGRRGRPAEALCTFKGPARESRAHHKIRVEREFTARDGEECLAVFAGIGFHPAFRYDKYRTKFSRRARGAGKQGHIVLDETPMGVFLELEGPAAWIDRTAKELGFSRDDYITMSYARLWEKWREEHGIRAGDMVFK